MASLSSARLLTPVEWFVIGLLARYYDKPFHVVTAQGTVITGVPLSRP